jgi:hypothetical protein
MAKNGFIEKNISFTLKKKQRSNGMSQWSLTSIEVVALDIDFIIHLML